MDPNVLCKSQSVILNDQLSFDLKSIKLRTSFQLDSEN